MENLIMVFLLFFAVLAAGWFYLQRAKARDAAKTGTPVARDDTAPPTDQAAPTSADEPR